MTRPQAVRRVHEVFLDAGADVLQTSSWGLGLQLEGRADRERVMFDTARRAAEIAKEAVVSRGGGRRYVAGIVYPGTTYAGVMLADELERAARCITAGLMEGGSDFLVAALANSSEDMRRLMAGIRAANAASLPVLAAYEWNLVGLLSGEDLHAAMMVAEGLGAFSSGVYVTTHLDCVPDAPFTNRTRPVHVLTDAGYATQGDGEVVGSLALRGRRLGGNAVRSLRAALMGESMNHSSQQRDELLHRHTSAAQDRPQQRATI